MYSQCSAVHSCQRAVDMECSCALHGREGPIFPNRTLRIIVVEEKSEGISDPAARLSVDH